MFKLWGFHDRLVLNSVDVVYCAIIWMENHHSWVAHPHLRRDDHCTWILQPPLRWSGYPKNDPFKRGLLYAPLKHHKKWLIDYHHFKALGVMLKPHKKEHIWCSVAQPPPLWMDHGPPPCASGAVVVVVVVVVVVIIVNVIIVVLRSI